jgi:hypothetical protein
MMAEPVAAARMPHSCGARLPVAWRGRTGAVPSIVQWLTIPSSVSVLPKLVAQAVSGFGATAVFERA